MRRLAGLIIAAVLAAGAPVVDAADAVTEAIDAAYPSYRNALFRTNAGAAAESEQAVAAARNAWAALAGRFGTAPTAPYDRDIGFARTLSEVDAVYARAAAEVRDGKLTAAHETLESVRDLIGELRRRNGVIAYSDHVNAYHAQMEAVLNEGPRLLENEAGMRALTLQVGVLDHLATKLDAEASAALRAQAGFGDALREVQASVAALRQAMLAPDAGAAKRSIAALKAPFSRLFLRFG